MQINTSPAAAELRLFFKSGGGSASDVYERLSENGLPDGTLCLLAEDEGRPLGALVVVPVTSGALTTAYAACAAFDGEFTAGQLYAQAFIILRERGIPYIFARRESLDDTLYYDKLKWEWMVTLGFVPPVLDNDSLLYAGKRLTDEAKPTYLPLEMPEALGIPVSECRFTAASCVDKNGLARQVLTTRERRRYAERAALVIFIIAVTAVGAVRYKSVRDLLFVLPAVSIGLVLLYRNIFHPKKVVAEVLQSFEKKGRTTTDDRYFFGENAFVCFSYGKGRSVNFYSCLSAVYDKPEFFFLCETSSDREARGHFIEKTSLEDSQVFLDFIRSKAPQAAVRK